MVHRQMLQRVALNGSGCNGRRDVHVFRDRGGAALHGAACVFARLSILPFGERCAMAVQRLSGEMLRSEWNRRSKPTGTAMDINP